MTIATSTNIAIGRGNGVTTAFNYGFIIPSLDDLLVTYTDADGVQTVLDDSQFIVTGIDDPDGGTVTYPISGSPIATGTSITIQRIVPYTQPTSLVNQGGYYPGVVEAALDNLEMQIQQAVAEIGTGIHYPAIDVDPVSELPPAAQRAGKFFGFDGNGDPAMLTGSALSGDLLAYTVGGAAWSNPLYATQNIINFNAAWYVTYTSSLANIIYGFASNVYRSSGADPNYTVGGQFSAYSQTGVSAQNFGVVSQSVNEPGGLSVLIGAEFAIAQQTHNFTGAKVGTNIVFKDRGDGVTAAPGGLGSDEYNLGAIGLWITSQQRSTEGEHCGWRRGIDFDEYAMDSDLNGGAIGIDFAHVHYYGGTDPLTAYRMTAAIRLRDFQSILWNGDPTLPDDPTEPTNPIRTYFDSQATPNARWKITNTGTERFGVDVVTGDIYVNGVLFSGSGSSILTANNTWTGTNTFNNTVSVAATFNMSGTGRLIQGDFTNATVPSRTFIQTNNSNSNSYVGIIPNGSGTTAGLDLITSPNATNCQVLNIHIDPANAIVASNIIGTASYVPLIFYASATEGFRLTTGNRVLIGTSTDPTVTAVKLRVNGMIQFDNAGCFYAHRNGVDQGSIATGVATKVVWTTVPFNQDSAFSAATGKWTPSAGKYEISAGVGVASATAAKRYQVLIYKNGSSFKSASVQASASDALNATITTTIDASGTDYFEVYFFQNSGFTASIAGAETETWFSGHRIG